ncbi:hypothetical protein Drorol1_Dr00024988 [Drosera rotundifolia]
MATKLPPFKNSTPIPKWVSSIKRFSSLPFPIPTQFDPKPYQNPPTEPNLKPENPSDLDPLMRALKWVRHGFDAGSCFGMILKMGLGRNVEGIESLCDEMIRYGCDEEGFEGLFDVLVRNGRVREAKRVMDAMDSSRWDRHCVDLDRFNAVLGAVVAGKGGLRDVVFVYKEMVKSSLVPNVETLNRLIEALFDAGKVDAALDQCGRMRKKGCVPNRRTFEIVIDRLVDHDRVDDSIGVMNEILRRPG